MKIVAQQMNGVLVISVDQDRIDAVSAIAFKDQMRQVTQSSAGRVVLDLAQVAFIDSSGLGAIVAAMKALAPAQKLELSGLTATVKKVFRLTRMDTVFTIHEDLPVGLAKAG
ncbi:MAG: STAS domain-containing protein [Cypionkella sp.]|nr:STAS domain-containing protein [Cypionkella sp.]